MNDYQFNQKLRAYQARWEEDDEDERRNKARLRRQRLDDMCIDLDDPESEDRC